MFNAQCSILNVRGEIVVFINCVNGIAALFNCYIVELVDFIV